MYNVTIGINEPNSKNVEFDEWYFDEYYDTISSVYIKSGDIPKTFEVNFITIGEGVLRLL